MEMTDKLKFVQPLAVISRIKRDGLLWCSLLQWLLEKHQLLKSRMTA